MALNWEQAPVKDDLEAAAGRINTTEWRQLGSSIAASGQFRPNFNIDLINPRIISLADQLTAEQTTTVTAGQPEWRRHAWRSSYQGLHLGALIVHRLVPDLDTTDLLADEPNASPLISLSTESQNYLAQRRVLQDTITRLSPLVSAQARFRHLATTAGGLVCVRAEQRMFSREVGETAAEPQYSRLDVRPWSFD